MITQQGTREPYIDFLRALGLLLLIVAHTFAHFWLKTARTFDVPLMVFVSSLCFHQPKILISLYTAATKFGADSQD